MRRVFFLAALIITSPAWAQTATPQNSTALSALSGKISDFERELAELEKTITDTRATSTRAQVILGTPGVLLSRLIEIAGPNPQDVEPNPIQPPQPQPQPKPQPVILPVRPWFVTPPQPQSPQSPAVRLEGPRRCPPELERFRGRFPPPLADPLNSSLGKFAPLFDDMRASMPDLERFEKRSGYLAEGFAVLDARLLDMEAFRMTMVSLVDLAKQRHNDALKAWLEALASGSPRAQCMMTGIDRTSAELRDLLEQLEAATKIVRSRIDQTKLDLMMVGALQSDFERLLNIDRSAESLQRQVGVMAQSLADVDSQLHSKVDLSFPYWGTTPQGTFGELLFPLQIETEVLLKGSAEVRAYIERTLSPSLLADAEEFGIKWVIHDVDADVPAVLSQLKGRMNVIANPTVEGMQSLDGIVGNATTLIAKLESRLTMPVDVADPASANYGFLELKPGADHRDFQKSLNALSPQSLSSSDLSFCR